jgi:hypothetical protein
VIRVAARIVANQSYEKRRKDRPILSSYVINVFHTDLPLQHSPEPVTLKTEAASFSRALKLIISHNLSFIHVAAVVKFKDPAS